MLRALKISFDEQLVLDNGVDKVHDDQKPNDKFDLLSAVNRMRHCLNLLKDGFLFGFLPPLHGLLDCARTGEKMVLVWIDRVCTFPDTYTSLACFCIATCHSEQAAALARTIVSRVRLYASTFLILEMLAEVSS